MNVANILTALRLTIALTSQLERLIAIAQEEGRDITDEELEQLRSESREALDRWLDLAPPTD